MVFSCFCFGKPSSVDAAPSPEASTPKPVATPPVAHVVQPPAVVDVPPTPEPATAPRPRDKSPTRISEEDIDVWSLVDPSSAARKAPRTILTATAAKAVAAQHDAQMHNRQPVLTEFRSMVRALSATVGDGASSPHTLSEAPSTASRGASPVRHSVCLSTATSAYHDAMSTATSAPGSPAALSLTGESHPASAFYPPPLHAHPLLDDAPSSSNHTESEGKAPPVRLGSHRLVMDDSGPSEEGTTHSSVDAEVPDVDTEVGCVGGGVGAVTWCSTTCNPVTHMDRRITPSTTTHRWTACSASRAVCQTW